MAKKNFAELFDTKQHKWSGLSLTTFLVVLAVTIITVYVPWGGEALGFYRNNFLISFTALAVFGILFGEIGDRIPFLE